MSQTTRILIASTLPPLVAGSAHSNQPRKTLSLARWGRLTWLLTALSLPVLGLSFADLVHRGEGTRTMQAAAPMIPSAGAAVSSRITRAIDLVRVMPPSPLRRDGRA